MMRLWERGPCDKNKEQRSAWVRDLSRCYWQCMKTGPWMSTRALRTTGRGVPLRLSMCIMCAMRDPPTAHCEMGAHGLRTVAIIPFKPRPGSHDQDHKPPLTNWLGWRKHLACLLAANAFMHNMLIRMLISMLRMLGMLDMLLYHQIMLLICCCNIKCRI